MKLHVVKNVPKLLVVLADALVKSKVSARFVNEVILLDIKLVIRVVPASKVSMLLLDNESHKTVRHQDEFLDEYPFVVD